MNPENYDQIAVSTEAIGPQAALLEAGMRVGVELVEAQPVSVMMPDTLEVRVEDTAPPVHQQTDSVWKPARLSNGLEIMVPQFIKSGDTIRLDVASLKYMDRVKGAGKN